ncbi:hypothetical protein AJ79_02233 [Helicocarpus griseus UAMH5409]|uniref:Uncharacterized protein n=1 Tax=Helicocarpus griseus UAMH5409 TaxID=1447875 RepID=A0A2B7Y319_9EURO|nr:hypothetical protein AJ79_02233 [Helicocarpus griseus UAMH5409]
MAAPATDLAGVIGTWIAVFFAILALVGVVGPLLVYLNLRTQRGQALNDIDDPTGVYVSRGIRTCYTRTRAFRRVKVPLLSTTPTLYVPNIFIPTGSARKGPATPSTTGWIMLSDVLWNYRLNLKYGDKLVFADSISYLPVHKNWILLLGLLGRYGSRDDNGLPIGEVANIPSTFLHASGKDYIRLSGISGTMLIQRRPSGSDNQKLYFHRHTLNGVALDTNDVPIETLLMLFLGYLSSTDGTIFQNYLLSSYTTTQISDEPKFFRLHSFPLEQVEYSDRVLFRELGIHAQSVFRFAASNLPAEEWAKTILETQHDSSRRLSEYCTDSGHHYYLKVDLYRFNLLAVEVAWSPHAAIVAESAKMIYFFNASKAGSRLISVVKQLLAKPPVSLESERMTELLGKAESRIRYSRFSRTSSRLWYDIDVELRKFWNTADTCMRAMSLLFLDFKELTEILGQELDRVVVDVSSNTITLIRENDPSDSSSLVYFFDFVAVFSPERIRSTAPRVELSAIQCGIACLQALVRMMMFRCVIDSQALSRTIRDLGDIVWVADSTQGVKVNPRHEKPSMYRASDGEESDSEPSDTSSANSHLTGAHQTWDKSNAPEFIRTVLDMEQTIVNRADDTGKTALHIASHIGNVGAAEALLEKGASVQLADSEGNTSLHIAASQGHLEIVQLLLSKKSDLAAVSNAGATPLHLAASNGHFGVVEELLTNGADARAVDQASVTPLWCATNKGSVDIVELLLDNGAEVSKGNNEGVTPVQLASSRGNIEVLQVLLDHGADVSTIDSHGRTVLHSYLWSLDSLESE